MKVLRLIPLLAVAALITTPAAPASTALPFKHAALLAKFIQQAERKQGIKVVCAPLSSTKIMCLGAANGFQVRMLLTKVAPKRLRAVINVGNGIAVRTSFFNVPFEL